MERGIQKGFTPIVVIIVLLIIGGLAGVFYFDQILTTFRFIN